MDDLKYNLLIFQIINYVLNSKITLYLANTKALFLTDSHTLYCVAWAYDFLASRQT